MCVWLPRWPLQRLLAARPELKERAVVIYEAAPRGGWRVVHASRRAREQGVLPGVPLAEARALLEGAAAARAPAWAAPHFEPHDAPACRAALGDLAAWCERYSPCVGLEEQAAAESLLADITGCAALFGGEEALAARVAADFQKAGLFARVAVADTPGAAWGVAHHAPGAGAKVNLESSDWRPPAPIVIPSGQPGPLNRLPVEALRLSPGVLQTLHELGVHQVEGLRAIPRESLPARLGAGVARRLDEMFGLVPEPIVPVRPCAALEAEWSFEEPARDRRAIEAVLRQLLRQLAEQLEPRRAGIQRLACQLDAPAQAPLCLTVGTVSPTACAEQLWDLLRLQLERRALPEEVARVRLEGVATGALESRQHALFGEPQKEDHRQELNVLLDRLGSRLGEQAVLRAREWPDHQPECACRFEPVHAVSSRPAGRGDKTSRGAAAGAALAAPGGEPLVGAAPRPLFLMSPPVPLEVVSVVPQGPPLRFRWAGNDHVVARSWGPERIETGWWRAPHVRRDYYRVETTTGGRFWLFRLVEQGGWYLHGAFE